MSEAAREAVRVERSPTRCPFCHQSIAPEGEEWIACAQCLGRHHTACWAEGGACAACGHAAPLSAAEAHGRQAGAPEAQGSGARARETLRAFDEQHAREGWWSDAILGPLTLGLLPLVRAEQRLTVHEREHDERLDPLPPDLEPDVRARLATARRVRLRSPVRAGLCGLTVVLPVLLFLWTWVSYLTISRPSHGGWDEAYWRALQSMELVMVLCQFPFLLGLAAHVHAVREAVRKHELAQLMTALVARGAGRQQTERLLARSSQAWNLRRVLDSCLTGLALIPFAGYLVVPFLAVRANGSLALHQVHEGQLDEDCPPPRAAPREKGAP